MSYANGTLNYNLPQTVGTDKRDWSDTNQAFADVDAALKSASDGASQATEDITALTLRVGTAEDDIAGLKAEDISLDGRLDTAEGAISTLQLQVPDVRSDVEDMITAFNEATATSTHAYSEGDYFIYNDVLYKATTSIGVGDTIVPNTNCEATNVTTEVAAINSDLPNIIVVERKNGSIESTAPNAFASVTIDASKTGYAPIGVVGVLFNHEYFSIADFCINSNNAVIKVENTSGSTTATETCFVDVLYKKN